MTLAAIIELGVQLARLGASPAVQELVHAFLARQAGVAPTVVTAAIRAALVEAEALEEPKRQ